MSERAAVLVIHGIGEQRPFQALDAFTRGLARQLEVEPGRLEHQLIWRDRSAVSALRLTLPQPLARSRAATVDLYEYYWADKVERKISLRAVLGWLARSSLTPLTDWSEQPALLFREAGPARSRLPIFLKEVARAMVLVLIAAVVVLPFVYAAGSGGRVAEAGRALWATLKDIRHPVIGVVSLVLAAFALLILRGGLQLLFHHRRPQTWLDRKTTSWWAGASVVTALLLLGAAVLLYRWGGLDAPTLLLRVWADLGTPPVLLPVLAALFAWATRGVLVQYLGDVTLYVTADERSSFFRTRAQILAAATEQARTLLRDPQYSAVYIAGHSLGSVIGYDTINRLAREVRAQDSGAPAKLTQADFDKLYGLLTFGSPLDKVYYFFRTVVPAPEAIRAQLLASLHGFHQLESGRDYGRFTLARYAIPEPAHFRWLNVYSHLDPVSGHLDFYNVTTQRARPYGNPITAHLRYWEDPGFYREVAQFL